MGTDTTYGLTYYHKGAAPYAITSTTQILMGMRGFGFRNAEIPSSRAPFTSGVIPVGEPMGYSVADGPNHPLVVPYLAPREMEITILIKAATVIALDTAYIAMLAGLTPFYPYANHDLYSYTLNVIRPYTGALPEYRDINCWCTGVSDMELRGRTNALVDISFYAPSPFFFAEWGTAAYITDWATGTNPKTVTNVGHAPVWPIIKILGDAAADVVGLHITNNTTGKIWSTSQTIATGAAKYIRVAMDRAMMYYNDGSDHDIISKMDTDAEFWNMPIGDNALQWSTTSGTPSSIVVTHPALFLGV